jgi:hypothetical protein
MGTSIKNYISKLKLYNASKTLMHTDLRIIDIALQYGYGSQEAFSRAFSSSFGLSPSAYRKKPLPVVLLYEQINEEGYKNMNDKTIVLIHEKIKENHKDEVLHILNGACMLEDFKNKGYMDSDHTYIPFNEAMCWGEAHEDIFTKDFIKQRALSLDSDENEYESIVIDPLKPLLHENFETIVLWFGTDMFCQINLLTLLAYLDSIHYDGDLLICMKNEVRDEMLADAFSVNVEGYYMLYIEVLLEKKQRAKDLPPVLYQGIQMYLSYDKEDSEVNKYIKKHIEDDDNELLRSLMKRYTHYGLGDLQYKNMMHKVKEGAV